MKFNLGLNLTVLATASLFFAGTVFATPSTYFKWEESSISYGECFLNDQDQAQQYKTVTYICVGANGNKDNECILDQTKTVEETESGCNIEKAYCHKNEGASGFTYHFNKAWIEHVRNNGTPQSGHELDFLTFEGDRDCTGQEDTEKTPVCADDSFDNYGGEDGKFDTETETADNTLCVNDEDPKPTPTPEPTPTTPSCSSEEHLDASGKNCVTYSVPGSDSGTGGAQIGQVLGASTMAATGAVSDALFNSIFTLGSLLTSFGIMKDGKKNKK